MAQVFLSYSRQDQAAMLEVKTALTNAGAAVWTDETLEPGTPIWQRTIETQIAAAACVVVLLSPTAKDSHWVRSEISRARLENIDIVPVIVNGKRDADVLPLGLENANWIDLRGDRQRGLSQLVATISQVTRKAASSGLIILPRSVSSATREGPIEDRHHWQKVGRVLRYYGEVNAAGVELTLPVQLGDLLYFGPEDEGLLQRVESIELDRAPVTRVAAGTQVGIRVWGTVQPGWQVERATDARRALYMGSIKHFYQRLSVATLTLESSLATGDLIEIRGPGTRFLQKVRSIEINRQRVTCANRGAEIGVAVILPVQRENRVYRIE